MFSRGPDFWCTLNAWNMEAGEDGESGENTEMHKQVNETGVHSCVGEKERERVNDIFRGLGVELQYSALLLATPQD